MISADPGRHQKGTEEVETQQEKKIFKELPKFKMKKEKREILLIPI